MAASRSCKTAGMAFSPMCLLLAPSSTTVRRRTRGRRRAPLFPQERLDPFFQFFERHRALQSMAIDEEGRGGIDLERLNGIGLIGRQLVELRLVCLAGHDILLAHAIEPA